MLRRVTNKDQRLGTTSSTNKGFCFKVWYKIVLRRPHRTSEGNTGHSSIVACDYQVNVAGPFLEMGFYRRMLEDELHER